MGITLTIMGVPLALPLAVLIGFGSLIPLIGAVVFGGIAVLVTLVTKGWVLAVVLIGVLVAENQAEAHLLQPFVVGRYVHLHPLAIALALATGTVFGGVWGALFAVPFTAAVWAAYSAIRGADDDAAAPGAPP
jgi:predicted PurR-regulated permease PerM